MKDDRLIAREKLEEARKNYEMGKYNNAVAYCKSCVRNTVTSG